MLKAKAKVYTLGEEIGTTRYMISDPEVLKNAIKSDKVPLVSTFDAPWDDPTKVIGHAELEVRDDGLYANLTFNGACSDIYAEAFNAGYEPRTGFHAVRADSKDGVVSSMEIRSVALNETCLGGKLDDIWEE